MSVVRRHGPGALSNDTPCSGRGLECAPPADIRVRRSIGVEQGAFATPVLWPGAQHGSARRYLVLW
jgi:hypothetical protein